MKLHTLINMILFFFVSQGIFAQKAWVYLDTFLKDEAKQALLEENKWTFFADSVDQVENIPPEFSEEICNRLKGDLNIVIESIYLMDNPFSKLAKLEQLTRIENILRNISSLRGIKYYSPSRRSLRLLYAESHTIDNPKNHKPIPDTKVTSYGQGPVRVYVFQKDLSFGENVYAWLYLTQSTNYLCLYITNLTPMSYSIMKLVDPQNLKSLIFVKPFEDKILFYSISGVHTMKFFGLEKSRAESFYQRGEAMSSWFEAKIKEYYSVKN